MAKVTTIAGSTEHMYTVPTGKRTILRDIRVANASGSGSAEWRLYGDSTLAGVSGLLWITTVASGSAGGIALDLVLEQGDNLYSYCTLVGQLIWISGAVLDVPPVLGDRVEPLPAEIPVYK